MQICKPFTELTRADKSMLLLILFPDDIEAFIMFTEERLKNHLNNPKRIEQWALNHKSIPYAKWVELIELLAEYIAIGFETLTTDNQTFATCFAKGHNQFFFLDALQAYTNITNNEQFAKAIEFLFDL